MTGIVTDIGIELGKLYPNRDRGQAPGFGPDHSLSAWVMARCHGGIAVNDMTVRWRRRRRMT